MGFLKGQAAIVTGGARGLGRGIALALAQEGASVVIADLLADKGKETAAEAAAMGVGSAFLPVDVTKRDQVEGMVAETVKRFGRLDILVNNAGNTTHPAWCWEMSDQDWHSVINTHINGTFYGIKAAAKFAIKGMTLTAAKELGPHGITVNALQPGVIRSDMTAILLNPGEEKTALGTPVRRVGEPEDVANAVSFFVNPASGFVTGVVMRVDGGIATKLAAEDDLEAYARVYPGKE